jgi:outer membrane protein TolC
MKNKWIYAFLLALVLIQFRIDRTVAANLLTLDQVLSEGMSNDKNLEILTFTLDMLNYQEKDTNRSLSELDQPSGFTLTTDPKTIAQTLPSNLPPEAVAQLIQTQLQINSTLNAVLSSQNSSLVSKQRTQLIGQLEQIKIQQNKTDLQKQSDREGAKLLLTREYIDLLSLKVQEDVVEKESSLLTDNLKMQNAMIEQGFLEKEKLADTTFELERNKNQSAILQLKYNRTLRQLLFQINRPLDTVVDLQPIEDTKVKNSSKPASNKEWIEHSFAYKIAEQDVFLADYVSAQTETARPDAKSQAEQAAIISRLKLGIVYDQLNEKIENQYLAVEESEREILAAKINLAQASEKKELMERQYQLGLISYYSFLSSNQTIENEKNKLVLAQLNGFLNQTILEYMENGYFSE